MTTTTTNVCCFYSMFSFLLKLLCLSLLILIYCEFIIYYFVLLGCSWPQLLKLEQDFTIPPPKDPNRRPLHVMLIADTHLFGSRGGHWLEKLRRDWQVYRSFQSARFLFEPNVIFVLGDLIHEGKWCSNDEWNRNVQRFESIFSASSNSRLYVLAGNRDIGFHYEVTDNDLKRFEHSFQASEVQLITIEMDHVHFILINSMAFEGDQCRLCERAENQLNEVINKLNRTEPWTRPVLLSHFPLYRTSDVNCLKQSPILLKSLASRQEQGDVLSQEATDHLLTTTQSRMAFSGHTHNYCYTEHVRIDGKKVPEWTIPSFSWQNRDDPSFMLLSITSNNEHVSHCYLPRESTIFWSYAIGVFLLSFYTLLRGRRPFCLVVLCLLRKKI